MSNAQTLSGQITPDTYARLVEQHGGMMYQACLRILGNTEDAKDATQNCFLKLLSRGRIPDTHNITAWLHRVATNQALDQLRSRARRKVREEKVETHNHSLDVAFDEVARLLDEAVVALPELNREPILLHYFEGLSQSEISERLDTSPRTISSRIQRGLDLLRNNLEKNGVSMSGAILIARFDQLRDAVATIPSPVRTDLLRLSMLDGIRNSAPFHLSGLVQFGMVAALVAVITGTVYFARDSKSPQTTLGNVTQAQSITTQDEPGTPLSASMVAEQKPGTNSEAAAVASDIAATSESKDLPLLLPAIVGRVYFEDSGRPVTETEIIAEKVGGGAERIIVQTDEKGNFRLEALPLGEWVVRARNDRKFPDRGIDRKDQGFRKLVQHDELYGEDIEIWRGNVLRGRVLLPDGSPAARALVHSKLDPYLPIGFTPRADEDGRFELFGIPDDADVALQAELPPYSCPRTDMRPVVDWLRAPIVLAMQPGASAQGMVVNASGQPKPNVRVRFEDGNEGGLGERTDEQGRFLIEGLHPATYALSVSHPDSGQILAIKNVEPITFVGTERLNGLVLMWPEIDRPNLTITGRVIGSDGKPVAGAYIDAMSGTRGSVSSAYTTKGGLFEVKGLASQKYSLFIDHGRYKRTSIGAIPGQGPLTIKLELRGGIAGRVLDAETGEPVERFRVGLAFGDKSGRPDLEVDDSDGQFVFENVPPGDIRLSISAEGYSPYRSDDWISVPSGEIVEGTVVELVPGRIATVRVVDREGQPVPKVACNLEDFRNLSWDMLARWTTYATNVDGVFEISAGVEEELTLHLFKKGYAPTVATVPPGATDFDVTMNRPATISGRVYHDGVPVPKADIDVDRSRMDIHETHANEDGFYVVEHLPPGETSITLWHNAGDTSHVQTHRVSVSEGEAVDHDFHIESTGQAVTGTLTIDGEVPDVNVQTYLKLMYPETDGTTREFRATINPDGTFRVSNVGSGNAEIHLWSRSISPDPIPVKILPGEVLDIPINVTD